MQDVAQPDREEMRNWVIDIVTNCHHGQPVPDCPARAIRELPLINRIALVGEMSDVELQKLLDHHWECSTRRRHK